MQAVSFLKSEFSARATNELSFKELMRGKSRKDAAGCFFELLVLSSKNMLSVHQEAAFGDIQIAARSSLATAEVTVGH